MRNFEEIIVTYYPDHMIPYPEYKGKPYFSIQYEENGEHRVGYGTFSPQVLSGYIKDDFNGRASIVEELEKIKTEIERLKPNNPNFEHYVGETRAINNALEVIDNHIAELKGEHDV